MFSKRKVPVAIGLVFLCGMAVMAQDSWSELGPNDKKPGASIVPIITLLLLADDAAPPDVVILPDTNLEQAVREAISKPTGEILASDLLELTELDLSHRGIQDLTGLEFCPNLTWLELSHNLISDISPLAGLTNLTYLNLEDNQISDLTPLSGLTNLETLVLTANQISDLTPLSGLTNLTEQLLGVRYSPQEEQAPQEEAFIPVQWGDVPPQAMRADGRARVILELQSSEIVRLIRRSAAYSLPLRDHPGARKARESMMEADAALSRAIQRLTSEVLAAIPVREYRVSRQYKSMPFLALDVSQEAYNTLKSLPGIRSIHPDIPVPLPEYGRADSGLSDAGAARPHSGPIAGPSMHDTIGLIGAERAWEKGYTGTGWHVAVLDTGIRSTHEFFQGKDILEACFSANADCPNNAMEMIGPGAAAHYPATYAGYDHGTHVAGTAAGRNPDNTLFGVAKDADIIAVNVFSRFYGDDCGEAYDYCVLAFHNDILAGLDYVYGLRGTHQIGSVNMSLGGDEYTTYCDTYPHKIAIDLLRAVNIPTAIGTHNDGYCGAVTFPACISTATAVMASTKSDQECSFNNWHALIGDLFAPGHSIYSATGGSDTEYESWEGTSMATPHVAGGFTLMRQVRPEDGVFENLRRLTEQGPRITSSCPGDESKPRIDIDLTFLEELFLETLHLGHNQISDLTPLSGLTSLTGLHLHDNQISDLTPLSGLTKLTVLDLHNNEISDLAPLVANPGLGGGDYVDLSSNPLSSLSCTIDIPALEGRGVIVDHDCGPPPSTRLVPDTGITKCYNMIEEISCPAPGQPFYGQDAHYINNRMSYTEHGNGTVRDNVTGLMWQQCSAGLGGADCSAGTLGTYTWANAITYCQGLNLGGLTDWRLPDRYELQSLVDYSIPWPGPMIDPESFPRTGMDGYWSSTLASGTSGAWIVHFDGGSVYWFPVSHLFYVRCVR